MNNFKKEIILMSHLVLEIIILLIWSGSIATTFYIATTLLLKFLIPDIYIPWSENLFALSNQQLSYYLIINFFAVFIALVYKLIKKEMGLDSLIKLPREEVVLHFITAVFFAHFFAGSIPLLQKLYPVFLVVISALFLLYLPLAVAFYKSGFQQSSKSIKKNFHDIWQNQDVKSLVADAPENKAWMFRLMRLLLVNLIFIISVAAIIFAVSFIAVKSHEYALYQRRLKETLNIIRSVPSNIIVGEKISLIGNNFGWRTNSKDMLVSDYGPVDVETWTEQKLDFSIPLHWEEGIVNLWVVRNKTDNPPYLPYKSNVYKLKIESRWSYYPTEDEVNSDSPRSTLIKAAKKIKRKIFLNRD